MAAGLRFGCMIGRLKSYALPKPFNQRNMLQVGLDRRPSPSLNRKSIGFPRPKRMLGLEAEGGRWGYGLPAGLVLSELLYRATRVFC